MFDSIQGGTTMKKVALLLSALLFLGCAAFGQALTQADRERRVKYLQQTRDGVVGATKGLSEAQMKFKPAPDRSVSRWTPTNGCCLLERTVSGTRNRSSK